MDAQIEGSTLKTFIQWDVRSWSKAVLYWDRNIDWDDVHCCLELGGKAGGLSLWLALKGKKIVCSDLKNIRENAEGLHLRYNVNRLITYQDIDATNIPYENYFDIIVFKSIIGGIGRNDNIRMQQKAFDEIYKALKPRGKLLFAENLIASPVHQQLRKTFNEWGDAWRYVSIEELKEFLRKFPTSEIVTTGILGTFGRNETQRSMLAAIDDVVLNKVCPPRWKYIAYGIAEK